MKRNLVWIGALFLAACAGKMPGAKPDAVHLTLAPDVVSSQDGTLHVAAEVVQGAAALENFGVSLTVDYVDRNGNPRMVQGTAGVTGPTGTLEYTVQGLAWEGAGTITAKVFSKSGIPITDKAGNQIQTTASFSVLDQSPPQVTILAVTSNGRVGPGLPFDVVVHATDEIGISQISIQAVGEVNGQDTQLVASGTTDGSATFSFNVPDLAQPGPTITLYAIASDLSGNLAAAQSMVLTVDPSIAFAVAPGLLATSIAAGSQSFLDRPTALAKSPKDGMLYVADNSPNTPCNNHCIRKVDPGSGAVTAGAVVNGTGVITGISFDATGDNLYYSDNQNRLMRLTYDPMLGYTTPTTCNVPGNQNPADPFHSVFDATLGLIVADGNNGSQNLKRQAACNGTTDPTDFVPNGTFNSPVGVATDPNGDFYVSDDQLDRIFHVTRAAAVSVFEFTGAQQLINGPDGIDWLAGGTSSFHDSLLVASRQARRVVSTRGNDSPRTLLWVQDGPVDVAVDGTVAYVLVSPQFGGQNGPGRIIKLSGL